jgi:hypothetical protein
MTANDVANASQRTKAQNNDYSAQTSHEVHGVGVVIRVEGNEVEAERIWMRLANELRTMQEEDSEDSDDIH